MAAHDKKYYTLKRARQAILECIQYLPSEIIAIAEAQKRVTSSPVTAIAGQPSFDEAMRDGYAIAPVDNGKKRNRYKIIGEIPAGAIQAKVLEPGTAFRIMTGGCVPQGATHILPYEGLIEQGGEIIVPSHLLRSTVYIKKKGSKRVVGERIVDSGVQLQAAHLALLSSCGVRTLAVTTRPSVGYVCTGSELRSLSTSLERGQKFSSNSLLLQGLFASFAVVCKDFGIRRDSKQDLVDLFVKIGECGLDMFISTGGMGPGKFDLVERAFIKAGGTVVFDALAMRPGKATLFGILGHTLFFGLPGPTHGVRALFNTLIAPTLWAMQRARGKWSQTIQAYLQHDIDAGHNDVLYLKDGVMALEGGRCTVRYTKVGETLNCYILLAPDQTQRIKGELVDVYLAGP